MTEKRFYWLKMMDNFFRQKEIKKLRKLAGGDTYTIIYQEMMLLSLENGGKLYFEDFGEDLAEEIALELDENPENVRMTMSYLMAHKLMTVHPSGDEYMMEKVPLMVGGESSAAERMRRHRAKKKNEAVLCEKNNDNRNNVTIERNFVTTELRREDIDIDIEKRDREDIEIEGVVTDVPTKPKKVRHKHGEYQNVLLTDEDMQKLQSEFPADWQERIERLSEYMASKGASYKNHLATIRAWARKEVKEAKPQQKHDSYYDDKVLGVEI